MFFFFSQSEAVGLGHRSDKIGRGRRIPASNSMPVTFCSKNSGLATNPGICRENLREKDTILPTKPHELAPKSSFVIPPGTITSRVKM